MEPQNKWKPLPASPGQLYGHWFLIGGVAAVSAVVWYLLLRKRK